MLNKLQTNLELLYSVAVIVYCSLRFSVDVFTLVGHAMLPFWANDDQL